MTNFQIKLEKVIKKNNSLLCIGLDSYIGEIPKHLLAESDSVFSFNKAIIDATADMVCCYKVNIAFYSAQGLKGLVFLQKTISYIHARHTGIPVILDAKRADIGNASKYYALEVFDVFGADAITVNPYLGFDTLIPFLRRKDKGIIILCRTSNPGACDFQDLKINGKPLYLKIAEKVVGWNKKYGNCLMVVGATWPEQLKIVRKIAPNIFFLVPGIGRQGGDLQQTLKFGLTKEKSGLIINVSRGIIYKSRNRDFAERARREAQKLKELINEVRDEKK